MSVYISSNALHFLSFSLRFLSGHTLLVCFVLNLSSSLCPSCLSVFCLPPSRSLCFKFPILPLTLLWLLTLCTSRYLSPPSLSLSLSLSHRHRCLSLSLSRPLVGPILVVEPRPVTVDVDSDVTLNCKWSGNPPLTLTWTKKGSSMVGSNMTKTTTTSSTTTTTTTPTTLLKRQNLEQCGLATLARLSPCYFSIASKLTLCCTVSDAIARVFIRVKSSQFDLYSPLITVTGHILRLFPPELKRPKGQGKVIR